MTSFRSTIQNTQKSRLTGEGCSISDTVHFAHDRKVSNYSV